MSQLIHFTFLFLTLFTASLAAVPTWSLPPLDVNTAATQPDNPEVRGAAQVSVDAAGNSYAVWVNPFGMTLYGSRLPFGASAWTKPQIVSNVAGTEVHFPSLAINGSGNGIVVWNNGPTVSGRNQVLFSTYNPTTELWSLAAPTPIDPTGPESHFYSFPQVAINASGQAVAVWDVLDETGPSGKSQVRAAFFDGTSWILQQTISGENILPTLHAGFPALTLPKVGIDVDGNAIAVWQRQLSATDTTLSFVVEASTFSVSSGEWSTPFRLAVGDTPPSQFDDLINQNGMAPQISVNSLGEAVAVWDLYTSSNLTFVPQARSFNGTSWSHVTTNLDGTETSTINTFPAVALNRGGQAVAAWISGNNPIYGARRDPKGHWTGSRLVDSEENFDTYPQVAIDANGQAVVVWEVYDMTTYRGVSAAISHGTKNRWSKATALIDATGTAALPKVATNAFGDTTAVWTNLETVTQATIPPITLSPMLLATPSAFVQSSTIVLAPQPAREFKGFVSTNTFPMQTECIHTLTWKASKDPAVIGYRLYSGKKLVATFPASKGPYTFTIRDACCGESTTYTLVTFSDTSKTREKIILQ
jgi:hypothetical protein